MHKKGISLLAGSAVGALAVGVTLCAGGASAVEQAGSATATVNVAVGSCSFERSAGSGTYMGTLANGAAPISVTGSTFKTLCNDGGGYAVYAVGYSNDELGNTDLISNLGASDNIHTGVYVDSSSPSSWAMKLENNSSDYAPAVINNTTGSDFTTFHAVPNNYTMVASYNGSTLDPSSGSNTGSTIKTTYQAYASYTQPAGTYTGQVKYTMVHPNNAAAPSSCPAGNICYDGNGATAGSMDDFAILADYKKDFSSCNDGYDMEERICYIYDEETGDYSEVSFDDLPDNDYYTVELLAPNYYKTGYGFAGWNTAPYGSGTSYGPNQTITTTDGEQLYARWIQSAGNLQGWNGCSNMSIGDVTALTDTRDSQTYAVAKLADNKCWMIENLRLNHNSTTSNWGNDNLSQGFGGVFEGLASKLGDSTSSEIANFSNSTTANSLYSTTNITGSNQGYRFPRYNNTNLNNLNTAVSSSDDSIYGYGNYYTWAAALANTNNYTGPTAQVDSKTSETVNTSICPTGWRLPYGRSTGNGNTGGGFYYLASELDALDGGADSSRKFRTYPNNFVYSGLFYGSSAGSRGYFGYYWSSTAGANSNADGLGLGSDSVYPGTFSWYKYYGLAVRCVLGS